MPEIYVQYEPTFDRSRIYCSGERLFHYHVSFQSRSSFHLMPRIDELILRFAESGLTANWRVFQIYENELLDKNASEFTTLKINDRHSFDKHQNDNNEKIISLRLEHVGGAIFILIIGYSTAFIVFLAEILIAKFSVRLE